MLANSPNLVPANEMLAGRKVGHEPIGRLCLMMPVTGAMDVVVPWLNMEVTSMPDDLWRVVIKVCCVVEDWRAITVVGKVRSITSPPMRARDRLHMPNLSLEAVSTSMSPLGFRLAAESERERDSKCDGGQQHFLIQHG